MVGDAAVEGRQPGDSAEPRAPRSSRPRRCCRRGRGRSARRRAPGGPRPAGRASARRPSCSRLKPMSGRAMARRFTTSRQAAYSARSERRNLRRAGTRANSVLDPDPGARRQRGRPLSLDRAVVDDARQPSAPRDPALQRQPRDAGDRGQRLAAETQRGDRLDLLVGKLGGGVALERERHLGGRHAAAVVGDLDPAGAAAPSTPRSASRRRRSRSRPAPSTRWPAFPPLHRRRCG